MKKKFLAGIIGGIAGLAAGIAGGGYLGLVFGGTYLGSIDFRIFSGIEGYELAAYMGAAAGAVILTPLGIKWALKLTAGPYNRSKKQD